MRVGRRNFLRLLGIGGASAPAIAKATSVEALTTLAGHCAPPLAVGTSIGTPRPALDIENSEESASSYIRMSDYLKLFGKLPEHIERDVRERSKYVGHLDPDIAALHSFSLNAKIAWQRERNYEREVERFRHMGWYESAQSAFSRLTGFRWQW